MNLSKLLRKLHAVDPVSNEHKDIKKLIVSFKGLEYKTYTRLHHSQSAIRRFSLEQKIIAVFIVLVLVVFALINFKNTLIFLILILSVFYFADLLFKFYLVILSLNKSPEITVEEKEYQKRKTWPTYSIICPLYHEPEMVTHFIKAIDNLDYPKNKIQAMLILEEDDLKTIKEIRKVKIPNHFKILVVPDGQPKTKPKACNYALQHAKGEYVVIYDAEDIPEKDQLKKAITAFEKLDDKRVVCLQAKLNYYNHSQNLLTRLFTLEYSQWFNLILTGLHQIDVPIPLGGTSNHFKRKHLELLQGWDPFNVTEDCDLGIRLYQRGHKTRILDSVTWEEANSHLPGWIRQRSRWIKGYIQTYFVHTRRAKDFKSEFSNIHIIAFQLIVGGTPLSMLINPMMWVLTISYFVFRPIIGTTIESFFPAPIFYIAITSLVLGNFLYVYYYMIGVAKREHWEMVKWFFLVPLYWLAMSAAAWIAVYQLFFKPFHWEKTTHGRHLDQDSIKRHAALLA